MANVAKHSRRILAAMRRGSIEQRVFPFYIPFDNELRPAWWNDKLASDAWGNVLGVHEYERGSRAGAIAVTDLGLAIFGEADVITWVPYASISEWKKLSKDPVSLSLQMKTKSGQWVELLFPHVGEAFAFVQFLDRAIWEVSRDREGIE